MSNRWRLDALYKSYDDPALIKDLNLLEQIPNHYTPWIKEELTHYKEPIQALERFIDMISEDLARIRKVQAYGHLNFTVDSKSKDAIILKNKALKAQSNLTVPLVALKNWLSQVDDLNTLASRSEKIKDHLFYFQELKKSASYMLSPAEEMLISKLSLTGSAAWETLQSKVSSQLTANIWLNGEEQTLPIMSVRNLAFSSDPELRKRAYHAELEAYKKHEEISASALNSIKGEVLTLSELRGFDSPLDETLFNSRMSREILDVMIEAMESHLPLFRNYVLTKAQHLGHENGMPFYDLFAPITSIDKEYTIDEAKTFIVNNFGNFSTKLSNFAQKCFDLEWVDFEPRPNKVGGAFCSNIPSIKESRILLNYTGKLKNVFTIAHELGHAYHGDCIMDESILNTTYPMPLAETASIFCETIVRNAVLSNADEALQLSVLENSLSSATQVVMDILSRFYFETMVFEQRKDHPLSVEEFKNLMCQAQIKSYGHSLDAATLHPYMWLNKTHYYYAARNYYNFPYAFGLLFARGLYAKYLEEGDAFIPKYDQLLNATGKMSIYDVCMSAGIDPTDKSFWEASLKQIEQEVLKYQDLMGAK